MHRIALLSTLGFLAVLSGCSAADRAPNQAAQAADGVPVDDGAGDVVTSEPVVGGPQNGSCADALGELVYTASRYEGGAAPPPGFVVGEQKLVYKGSVVGVSLQHAGGGPNGDGIPGADDGDQDQPWQITLRFDDASKQVLESSGNRAAGSETYAQEVTGTFVKGLGPTLASHQFTTFVLCQDHWNFLRP
jgi:hypothetical protein